MVLLVLEQNVARQMVRTLPVAAVAAVTPTTATGAHVWRMIRYVAVFLEEGQRTQKEQGEILSHSKPPWKMGNNLLDDNIIATYILSTYICYLLWR